MYRTFASAYSLPNNSKERFVYKTMAELKSPDSVRENWYMSPTGSVYELNQTGLSGAGPAWGPKMNVNNKTSEKIGLSVLLLFAIAIFAVTLFLKYDIKTR